MMTSALSSTSKRIASVWKLGGLTPWQLSRNVFRNIAANNLLGLASDLAFNFIFALFPLILLMVTLFGVFASSQVNFKPIF